jgi:hypothetical protein
MGNNQQKIPNRMKTSVSMMGTSSTQPNNKNTTKLKLPQSLTSNTIATSTVLDQDLNKSNNLKTHNSNDLLTNFKQAHPRSFKPITCFNLNNHHNSTFDAPNAQNEQNENHLSKKISIRKRFLNTVRRNRSNCHSVNVDALNKVKLDSPAVTRSNTDHNLLVIKDYSFSENALDDLNNENNDFIDLGDDTEHNELLTSVNNKLKALEAQKESIYDNDSDFDDDYDKLNELDPARPKPKLNTFSKLTKSPAIFNIKSFQPNENIQVKDLLADNVSSSSSKSSSSSLSLNDPDAGGYTKASSLSSLSVSTLSLISSGSISSLSSSSSTSNDKSNQKPLNINNKLFEAKNSIKTAPSDSNKPKQAKETTKRKAHLINRDTIRSLLLPGLKCKSKPKPKKMTLEEKESLIKAELCKTKPTESELYSFKDRFEIRDEFGDNLNGFVDLDSSKELKSLSDGLSYIDEGASIQQSTPGVSTPSVCKRQVEISSENQKASAPLRFLSEVNKKLQAYHKESKKEALIVENNLKKQRDLLNSKSKPTRDDKDSLLESVSNKFSYSGKANGLEVYNNRIIDYIINKKPNFDFNNNDNEYLNYYCNKYSYDENIIMNTSFNSNNANNNVNDNVSVYTLRISAPLASSENTTLSSSNDNLSQLSPKYQSSNKNANLNSNSTASTITIKPFDRLSHLSANFNLNRKINV